MEKRGEEELTVLSLNAILYYIVRLLLSQAKYKRKMKEKDRDKRGMQEVRIENCIEGCLTVHLRREII